MLKSYQEDMLAGQEFLAREAKVARKKGHHAIDKAWIAGNSDRLFRIGRDYHGTKGRGALFVIDQTGAQDDPPMHYVLAAGLTFAIEQRAVATYNPVRQVVVVLLRRGGGSATYKIGF